MSTLEIKAKTPFWYGSKQRAQLAAAERAGSKITGIPIESLYVRSRQAGIAYTRFIVWYGLKKRFGWSYPMIAETFGMDHTSVIHGVQKAEGSPWSEEMMKLLEEKISTCPQP